jgi:hypothetical protein
MSSIYPEKQVGQKPLIYVEFNRGDKPGEFTLFQRNFMYPPEEWEKMKKSGTDDFASSLMSNEVHPWNLFTGEFCEHDNGIPNRKWIEWMVDAMNEKIDRDKI